MRSKVRLGVALDHGNVDALSSSTAQAEVTVWSTNAAACVPVSASGVIVTAAITAGAGNTVTLLLRHYAVCSCRGLCQEYRNNLQKRWRFRGVITGGLNTRAARAKLNGVATLELIEMSKQTGAETVKCGVQSKGSLQIATERNHARTPNSISNKNLLDYV